MYIEIVNPIFEFFKELGFKQDMDRIIKKEALLNYNMILRFFNKYNAPPGESEYKLFQEENKENIPNTEEG